MQEHINVFSDVNEAPPTNILKVSDFWTFPNVTRLYIFTYMLTYNAICRDWKQLFILIIPNKLLASECYDNK